MITKDELFIRPEGNWAETTVRLGGMWKREIKVEDMYQAFKERMIIELAVENNGSRTGQLVDKENK